MQIVSLLIPIIIIVAVALVLSPDPLITKICQIIIFVVVLIVLIQKLLPLIA